MTSTTMTESTNFDEIVFDSMTSRMSTYPKVIDWSCSEELDMASESARLAVTYPIQAGESTVKYYSRSSAGLGSLEQSALSSCFEETATSTAEANVELKVKAEQPMSNSMPAATSHPVLATEVPESTPMLPGLRLQNLQAAGMPTTSPKNTQAEDVSPAGDEDCTSCASSDSPALDDSSIESQKPISFICALQSRGLIQHLRASVDDGAPETGGTPAKRVASHLEDLLSPCCMTGKADYCKIPFDGRTAKEHLQYQADKIRNSLQADFRKADRERAGHERNFRFLCNKYGKADALAMCEEYEREVKRLGPYVRALNKGRMDVAFQEGDDDWDM